MRKKIRRAHDIGELRIDDPAALGVEGLGLKEKSVLRPDGRLGIVCLTGREELDFGETVVIEDVSRVVPVVKRNEGDKPRRNRGRKIEGLTDVVRRPGGLRKRI